MDNLKMFTDKMLQLKYYENDIVFFSNKISLSCFEQAQYQSLRKLELDYSLVFCNDINIEFSTQLNQIYLKPHYLNYNSKLFKYHCITKDNKEAERSMDMILSSGNIVVFRTAMDYLHTYTWYHPDEPYTRVLHYSVIIGCDQTDYFYIDVPGTRNQQFFRKHSKNSAVGRIKRDELLRSFQYACEIGYIEINETFTKNIANIDRILGGIKNNFHCTNDSENSVYIGKQALEKLATTLKDNTAKEQLILDEFIFELLASRHILLKKNLCKYKNANKQQKCILLLDELTTKWRTIKNIVIKNQFVHQNNMAEWISNILTKEIIPLSEELILYISE